MKEDPIVEDRGEVTRYRALAAIANYLAQDRTDIQFSSKEICRDMAQPRASSWVKLRRLARYLLDFPRVLWSFWAKEDVSGVSHTVHVLDCYCDSDWAGCLRTRKSTSGGVLTWGGSVLKSWSTTQSTIALSSGEAE